MRHGNEQVGKSSWSPLINIIPVIFFCYSCNFFGNSLLGKFESKNTLKRNVANEIKSITLKKNNIVEIEFSDTLISGSWNEFDDREFHYIEVLANNTFKQMEVRRSDSITELYFVGQPTDFRGRTYDSLSFVRINLQ